MEYPTGGINYGMNETIAKPGDSRGSMLKRNLLFTPGPKLSAKIAKFA
jgi:hypothetical protein